MIILALAIEGTWRPRDLALLAGIPCVLDKPHYLIPMNLHRGGTGRHLQNLKRIFVIQISPLAVPL